MMIPDYRADNPYQSLLSAALESEGVEVVFPAGYRRILPFTRALTSSSQRIEIIHLHWLTPYIKGTSLLTRFLYGLKLIFDLTVSRLLGSKLIWTVHNLWPHEQGLSLPDRMVRMCLARLSSRTITHSHFAKSEVVKNYDIAPDKICVIPHGHYKGHYPPKKDRVDARLDLSLGTDERIFLFFGSIRPYKGLEELLTTWRKLRLNATLVVAGQPSTTELAERVFDLSAQQRVKLLLRKIDDSEVSTLFSAADVAVFPFRNTLTSGSVALAMSYNVPVIAPRLGGISEMLAGADELLYANDNPKGLEGAIMEAASVSLSQLRRATKVACSRYSWGDIAQSTRQCYEQALGQKA